MSTKLTLAIDKEVIEMAKAYAKSQQRSLSNLIEEYLKSITGKEKDVGEIELTPIVKSLMGSIKVPDPETFDEKQILEDELMKKYLG